ncbi:MAG TPA: pyridine nucleotide-disulfide oxidoreductase [Prevotellaceae bacterium]|nr:pyridine nucleotide-disulfide oxidoreductase [Prevotellaceae bacterium]
MRIRLFLLSIFVCIISNGAEIWLETENFKHKGGWVVDQQFMDEMGSSYLLAHGMGKAVEDAWTDVEVPISGTYYIYVRTYNWTSPWHSGKGPGAFQLLINGKSTGNELGCEGTNWMWQSAGFLKLKKGKLNVALHDLSGFEGRCDAIYLTTKSSSPPPSDKSELKAFRRSQLKLPKTAPLQGKYDFIVCGAGTAGISAAVAAARLGCKVALINDRPIIGGNNSSEIRVHTSGHINIGTYTKLGDLQKEFNPRRGGNAQPADFYEDQRKMDFVKNEKGIELFTNYRVTGTEKDGDLIKAVIATHIETGKEIRLEAPLFCDCTGDGTVGFLAGADYRMGREARNEFNESRAPEQPDSMTLGASVMWYSVDLGKACSFPLFDYGMHFTDESCERVTMGEWTWETGMQIDKTKHFEQVRDYGMLVIYANWSYLKNKLKDNDTFKNRDLGWVAYVSGKRESRRLLGDYILKQEDITRYVMQEDGTAATSWPMDLHSPDPKNSKFFPGKEFKAINTNTDIYPYPIPYRCLYSRNINNLFMAGRDISVTHVAHGSIRVMRTTGMMGEVVGMAASICKARGISPRDIYRYHFEELKSLMQKGVGKESSDDNQRYNLNYILPEKPKIAEP